MDQHKRLLELIEEANELSGGTMVLWGIENMPTAMAIQFMERVIAYEKSHPQDGAPGEKGRMDN